MPYSLFIYLFMQWSDTGFGNYSPCIKRVMYLNYIGSKYSLMDFITETIGNVTGSSNGEGHIFADLFAGTGVVGAV